MKEATIINIKDMYVTICSHMAFTPARIQAHGSQG